MRISIHNLKENPILAEVELSPQFLAAGIEEELRFAPGLGNVTFKMVGEQVLATGELRSTAYGPCARCLDEVAHPIRANVQICFWPRKKDASRGDNLVENIAVGEPDVGYYKKGTVEPDRDLREVLVVEAPGTFLCAEDCKGLCPACGANRNKETCACGREEAAGAGPKANASWKDQIKNLKLTSDDNG